MNGYVSIVLHAHLPFVRHPEYAEFFEERWLFEAITECYVPLLRAFDRMLNDGVQFRIAVSISPTLAAMLDDELLRTRYLRHMEKLIELSYKEVARTQNDPVFHRLATFHREWFLDTVRTYDVQYGRDLLKAFRRFRDAGVVELMTTTATHGFLPLLKTHPAAVRAQVLTGASAFTRSFGEPAQGVWIPECAFYPGLERVLKEAGYRFFIVDSHGITNASVRPHYGLFAPIACPNGVAAFGRDPESSRQVWSAHEGYPGDFDYREYHRDIGHELDFDYIKPYILDGKIRINTGIKYHRVTGSEHKQPYDPDKARAKAEIHAQHFLACRQKQALAAGAAMDRPPVILSPYDAELFGHWWFEGPQFLEFLFRTMHADQDIVKAATPSDVLDAHPVLQRSTPSASTWGWQGYNDCWLSGCNEWIYPHLHHAARVMTDTAAVYANEPAGTLRARALNQAARSLLLAQSSDWPFIMKCGTAVEYANRRVRDQLARFHFLIDVVARNDIPEQKLAALERLDNVFPGIDFRVFLDEKTTAQAVDLTV